MSPRRGGGSSSGGLSGSLSDSLPDRLLDGGTSPAGNDDDYSSPPSSSDVTACTRTGMVAVVVVITAIFLVIYIVIALWYIAFLLKGRKIKGVPLLLRFRFGACLFCLILQYTLLFFHWIPGLGVLKGDCADWCKVDLLRSNLHRGIRMRRHVPMGLC
ncbi:hypothetical protein BDW72DRAFT_29154 [Aspergillus terricola var. indicus]